MGMYVISKQTRFVGLDIFLFLFPCVTCTLNALYIGALELRFSSIRSQQAFFHREKRKENQRETMAGIVHKIGETLNPGGNKKEDQQHQGQQHRAGDQYNTGDQYRGENRAGDQYKTGDQYRGENRAGDQYRGEQKAGDQYRPEHQGEHKEGFGEKIKDKLHGGGGEGQDGKKKKERKKHGEGHDGSSSDSD
jgi:hypothetical protein